MTQNRVALQSDRLFHSRRSESQVVGFVNVSVYVRLFKGSHRLEKYLNLEGFLEKPLKIKSALKSTGKSLKSF